jgi:hypothetical protein
MRRLALAAATGLLVAAVPAPVAAHSLGGLYESPLPLSVYLVGAALAVGLSFAFLMLRDVRASPAEASEPRTVQRPLRLVLRAVGLVGWLWIVAQAVIGGSSDADVASLFVWVYVWVGVAAISALLGPVWTWLNPIATLYDLLAFAGRALGVSGGESAPYPRSLGQWPAVAGFAFFVWLELAFPLLPLGWVVIGYTIVSLAAMAQWGRDTWLENGETFSVWFDTLGRMAPIARVGPASSPLVTVRGFASGLLDTSWSPSRLVLVALGAGAILYDGLSQTEPWFSIFGLVDTFGSTLLLAGFLLLVTGVVLLVARSVGRDAIGAGLLPIAVGYLVAHYLTYLLGDGQRIVNAIADPFQLGWNLFGLAFFEPSVDWLPPALVWTIQLASVVGGHVLGAWSGHVVAARSLAAPDLRLRQLPLAALMVALTTATLWSLGQAIVAEPVDPAAAIATTAESR